MLEISSVQLKSLIQEKSEVVLVDIREKHETVSGKVLGALHIPVRGLTFLLPKLDRNKYYVVICYRGTRSMLATKLMRSYGFHASSLNGGYCALEVECNNY